MVRRGSPTRICTKGTSAIRHVSMSNQCVRTSRRHSPWPAESADGTEAARLVARAGRPAQPSAARIRLPEGAVRKVPASAQRAYIPDTYAHRASTQELGRILIPGDGAAGDQGLRIGLPARQRRLPDACGLSRQRLPGAMGLSRTCRLVTTQPSSTWPDQARLALPAVTHRYNAYIAFGSNNFRSPNRSDCRLRHPRGSMDTEHPDLIARARHMIRVSKLRQGNS
jgi:hypothetical protein